MMADNYKYLIFWLRCYWGSCSGLSQVLLYKCQQNIWIFGINELNKMYIYERTAGSCPGHRQSGNVRGRDEQLQGDRTGRLNILILNWPHTYCHKWCIMRFKYILKTFFMKIKDCRCPIKWMEKFDNDLVIPVVTTALRFKIISSITQSLEMEDYGVYIRIM